MEDKSPIFIVIILVIMLGFIYIPLKNSSGRIGSASKRQPTGTVAAISENRQEEVAPGLGYSPNKISAEQIKEIEKEINNLENDLNETAGEPVKSPYYGKVKMSRISGVRTQDPSKEYLTLTTDLEKTETVNITGWYLKSAVTGYYAVIGKASLLPFPFTRVESDIILQQKDKVILTKGFSPIGISFRTNKCTGFFEENRTFIPHLPLKCPLPEDEKLPKFSDIYDRNDECLDIIERIPRCTTKGNEFIRDLPDTVPQSCKTYITTQINYNSCVANHFDDTDFPGNEYRVYLNKFGPLWRLKNEKINLHDRSGLIVDSISY